jgi:hypothetical protein
MDQLRLKGPDLKRHKQRVSIYASTYAKLEVKPGGVLETCYGDVPPELVELIASYLHPRDVARMRSVSSGWRAALWQERVVRASLHGCGRFVHACFMMGMLRGGGGGVGTAIFDKLYTGDMVCWQYVLSKMRWSEHVRQKTEGTTTDICLAVVPLGTSNTHAQWLALDRLPRSIGQRV